MLDTYMEAACPTAGPLYAKQPRWFVELIFTLYSLDNTLHLNPATKHINKCTQSCTTVWFSCMLTVGVCLASGCSVGADYALQMSVVRMPR
jgi:hypothetical protein